MLQFAMPAMARNIRLGLAIGLLSVSLPIEAAEPSPRPFSGSTMGTRYSVVIADPLDESHMATIQSAVDADLQQVNRWMSTWDPDSEISRFNADRGTDWFDVSPETASVVLESLRISEISGGAFDVTVGPLVGLWGFGSRSDQRLAPDEFSRLQEAGQLPVIGFGRLSARLDPPGLKKSDPTLNVDLSAIAKGYGVDRVARLLEAEGISSFLVEIGGELRARGSRADGSSWRVGIEAPVAGRRELQLRIELNDQALATSGDYRQFYELNGRRVSHVIDPRTQQPVEHELASVSVLSDTCATADALATMLLVLGPEEGYRFAEEQGLAAHFVIRDGEQLTERMTPSFAALVIDESTTGGGFWMLLIPALVVFGIAIAGMAIGVIVSNRRIKGSCGGLAGMQDEQGNAACFACSSPSEACRELGRGQAPASCSEQDSPDAACSAESDARTEQV